MENDSEEKIIEDWNAQNDGERSFSCFNDLYKFIKGHSREQGIQSKKNIFKHSTISKYLDINVQREIAESVKKSMKQKTAKVLAFRARIKNLKKK